MRLIVFDLDGTLVDSCRDLAAAVNAMLAELERPELPEDQIGDMVGEGARVLVRRALAVTPGAPPDEDRALERFLARYDERLLDHTRAYEGISELLHALSPDATLAVLTNKPRAATERILDGLGLRAFFQFVEGGDGPLPRKPDPSALLDLICRGGATRDRTTLVGDSRVDLQTARNAGVRACIAGYGFGFRFEPAELAGVPVARTPLEILSCVGTSRR